MVLHRRETVEVGKISRLKKILHVFYTRKQVYVKNFVRFVSRNAVLRDGCSHSFFFFDEPLKGTVELLTTMHATDLVVFHGFFLPSLFFKAFFLMPWLHKKSFWVTWGGDVYEKAPESRLKLVDRRVNSFLKRFILPRMAGIGSNAGDYNILRSNFGKSIARGYFLFYPNPVDFALLDGTKIESSKKVVMIGNSGSKTNEHGDALGFVLESTARFTGDTRIICPLSNGEKGYVNEIVRRGKYIFDDFVPLLKFVGREEYAAVLKSVDVAVMYHDRQEGFGTVLALLYAGAKVYMKNNVSTFGLLELLGIKVHDVDKIGTKDFFEVGGNEKAKNAEMIRAFFSEDNCAGYWNSIFCS